MYFLHTITRQNKYAEPVIGGDAEAQRASMMALAAKEDQKEVIDDVLPL